jgi:hypothetical protein
MEHPRSLKEGERREAGRNLAKSAAKSALVGRGGIKKLAKIEWGRRAAVASVASHIHARRHSPAPQQGTAERERTNTPRERERGRNERERGEKRAREREKRARSCVCVFFIERKTHLSRTTAPPTSAAMSSNASKSFVKKTKGGRVMKVVREHYLRDDIYVGCSLASEEHRGPDQSTWKLDPSAAKYVVIDTNVALHQLDLLAHAAVTDVVVLSVGRGAAHKAARIQLTLGGHLGHLATLGGPGLLEAPAFSTLEA